MRDKMGRVAAKRNAIVRRAKTMQAERATMDKRLAPRIFVVFLWHGGAPQPPYFADQEPDLCAIAAAPGITHVVSRTAYLVYD